jgi:hypothetical protein
LLVSSGELQGLAKVKLSRPDVRAMTSVSGQPERTFVRLSAFSEIDSFFDAPQQFQF